MVKVTQPENMSQNDPDRESHRVRVIEPMMDPVIVRTSKTVLAIFLGEGSQTEAMFFAVGVKNTTAQIVLWVLCYIGLIFSMLVLAEQVPNYCLFGCMLALPLPAVAIPLLSADIIAQVLCELEFWLVCTLQMQMVYFILKEYYTEEYHDRWTVNCFAVATCLPFMLTMGLIDAYPAKYKAHFQLCFAGGATAIFFAWNSLIVFKHGNWAPVTHRIMDSVALLVFYGKQIKVAVTCPDAFNVLTSSLHTRRCMIYQVGPDNDDVPELRLVEAKDKVDAPMFCRSMDDIVGKVEVAAMQKTMSARWDGRTSPLMSARQIESIDPSV